MNSSSELCSCPVLGRTILIFHAANVMTFTVSAPPVQQRRLIQLHSCYVLKRDGAYSTPEIEARAAFLALRVHHLSVA